jgi:hypothetical protein
VTIERERERESDFLTLCAEILFCSVELHCTALRSAAFAQCCAAQHCAAFAESTNFVDVALLNNVVLSARWKRC